METLPDKVEVVKGVLVKYKGLFDFEGLYRMMQSWFVKNRWIFHERVYKDKFFSPLGSETEISWEAILFVNEYTKYVMSVEFHLWDAKEVEIVEAGNKKKMMRCRMTITLGGTVEFNYTKIFKDKGFTKFLGDTLKKLRRRELEIEFLQPLEDQVFMLQTEIKKFLNMQTRETAYYQS